MTHYCTLFDRNYLYRGMALHSSLLKHAKPFTLWILALDENTYAILKALKLACVKLLTLKDIEDKALLKVKPTRTQVEYYWTLTPCLPLYLLTKYSQIPMITYLDADLYFFSSPTPIFKEFRDASVAITEHRYSPAYRHYENTSGKYNVQFLTFRNNDVGRRVLSWWRARCLEWCYQRFEDGKFGDQRYLDDWPTRFKGIHIIKHLGAGLAPWNVKNYKLRADDHRVYVNDALLIFFHFHGFRLYSKSSFALATYSLTGQESKLVYRPYLQSLSKAIDSVALAEPHFSWGFNLIPLLPSRLANLKKLLLGAHQ